MRDQKGNEVICPFCHGLAYQGRTGVFELFRISPDGRRIAFSRARELGVMDIANGTFVRGITDGTVPLWTPDGTSLVFGRSVGEDIYDVDLFIQPSDASAAAERVLSSSGNQYPVGWLPDGRTLVIEDITVIPHFIWTLDLQANVRTKFVTPGAAHNPIWSADGERRRGHGTERSCSIARATR